MRWSTTSAPSRSAAPRSSCIYVGRNHSDNSLVMRLPKEKLIFTVDFVPIQAVLFRNLPDTARRRSGKSRSSASSRWTGSA